MPGYENLKPPKAFFSFGCPTYHRFVRFVALLKELFGVDLAMPSLGDTGRLSALKKFCGGLIEGTDHPWRRSIGILSRDSRMSIAMSLFLFRKTLSSPEPDVREYAVRMSSSGTSCDQRFVEFARREVSKMFPVGWDAELYPNAALSSVLSRSSCSQAGRAKGGCRKYVLGSSDISWNSHAKYVERVLTSEAEPALMPSRVAAVETGGKWRIISAADCRMSLLKPLNTAIYNKLSRFDWLLRGEAKVKSFKDFTRKPGEVFVSGDYESATDNLSMETQKSILSPILENATWVPNGIRDLAAASQQGILSFGGEEFLQRRGQLMGNLLSFPLLCIVNYLAFRYYTGTRRGELPVKINGDDIVFRSSPEIAEKWMAGVKGSGLVLSRGKTMINGSYFSLNSKLFVGRGKVKLVPSIRSTAFGFKDVEDGVYSLRGRWKRVIQDFPCSRRKKVVLATHFLRLNVRFVVASRRSITRGLDMGIPYEAIMANNLWRRECFYLSFPKEDPLPISPKASENLRIPEGWECRRVENETEEMKEKNKEIGPLFVQLAWNLDECSDIKLAQARYEEQVRLAPAFRPSVIKSRKKQARLLKLSTANTRRFLKPSILRDGRVLKDPCEIVKIYRPGGKRLWLPIGFLHRDQFSLKGLGRDRQEIQGDPTPGISLGRGTVWDCSSEDDEPRLIQCLPGARVKLFKGYIGIGPPTSF
uniref:RNA-dependent RNA polymerase n=1 Tax=Tonghua Botou tick virus 3 TaxID=2972074 RepID=A0A9E8AA17_9VIRU|nr:MAG: RNA-dependent RNA polymerase [Tonghua Botou tick virus 3]